MCSAENVLQLLQSTSSSSPLILIRRAACCNILMMQGVNGRDVISAGSQDPSYLPQEITPSGSSNPGEMRGVPSVPHTVAALTSGELQPIGTANKSDPLIDPLLSLRRSITTQLRRKDLVFCPSRGHWVPEGLWIRASLSSVSSGSTWVQLAEQQGGTGILSHTGSDTFLVGCERWNGALCWMC